MYFFYKPMIKSECGKFSAFLKATSDKIALLLTGITLGEFSRIGRTDKWLLPLVSYDCLFLFHTPVLYQELSNKKTA
jgi:hypothetical protein